MTEFDGADAEGDANAFAWNVFADRPRALRRTIAKELRFIALVSGLMLGIATLAIPAVADERPRETRVDLYDSKSQRTGSAILNERTGRVDFYDTRSNRTGYGTVDRGGTLQLFDLKGNRVGSGQVVPGTTRPGGRSQ